MQRVPLGSGVGGFGGTPSLFSGGAAFTRDQGLIVSVMGGLFMALEVTQIVDEVAGSSGRILRLPAGSIATRQYRSRVNVLSGQSAVFLPIVHGSPGTLELRVVLARQNGNLSQYSLGPKWVIPVRPSVRATLHRVSADGELSLLYGPQSDQVLAHNPVRATDRAVRVTVSTGTSPLPVTADLRWDDEHGQLI